MINSLGRVSLSILLLLFTFSELGQGQHEKCPESRCSENGPIIRFPFRLKGHQPDYCGYPGLVLSCSDRNDTVLELPVSIKLYVDTIDYSLQMLSVHDPDKCFPKKFRNLNLSTSPYYGYYSPYYFPHGYDYELTFFNCSSAKRDLGYLIDCMSTSNYKIYVIYSSPINRLPLESCTKMYNISSQVSLDGTNDLNFQFGWSKPDCQNCQARGGNCTWNRDSNKPKTVCFDNKTPHPVASKGPVIIGIVLGVVLLILLVIVVYWVRRLKMAKQNQISIEKFLEDYKVLKPTRFSYADIKRITNNFKDELGRGGYGIVYKGQLSSEIPVAVKVLNNSDGDGEEFINEVATMGRIHHVNVVRLVGFSADGFRRALVFEYLPNNSLVNYISSSDAKNHSSLSWEKLLEISLGIAKGIEYLHQGCDQRILHFDIKPHNILLDHNFIPKISDFGQAKLCSKDKSTISMTAARGTMGYIAPEVFSRNFGGVSYKSDIYSFGMLLLEMVKGSKNVDVNAQYFPEWIYNRLERREELEIRVEQEEDYAIARKLAIVGLWCIQWYPVERPSMKVVVQMLEGEGDSLTVPPNPFGSSNPMKTTVKALHGKPFNGELEVISEQIEILV